MARSILTLILLMSLAIAAFPQEKTAVEAYTSEIEKWRVDRQIRLKAEEGWLSLVGLFWLKDGENKFGSGAGNDIVFPARVPDQAGSIWLEKGIARLQAKTGANITSGGKPVGAMVLHPDTAEEPTRLELGDLTFLVIERGGKFALRVKDRKNPDRFSFSGLQYFPIDSRWKIEATFEPYKPVKMIPILNILGMLEDQPSPGALVFTVNGVTHRLDAISETGVEELFIMFADQTSGKETYGAGRYLYAAQPGPNGKAILDFNRAYNPPCAFTSFATCPLPPKQNRLAIRVEAGEKSYQKSK